MGITKVLRAIVFVFVDLISWFLIQAPVLAVVSKIQGLAPGIGLFIFVIFWGLLLRFAKFIYKNIARISPYKRFTKIVVIIIQGGGTGIGILMFCIPIFATGISFPIILMCLIRAGLGIALCKQAMIGVFENLAERQEIQSS